MAGEVPDNPFDLAPRPEAILRSPDQRHRRQVRPGDHPCRAEPRPRGSIQQGRRRRSLPEGRTKPTGHRICAARNTMEQPPCHCPPRFSAGDSRPDRSPGLAGLPAPTPVSWSCHFASTFHQGVARRLTVEVTPIEEHRFTQAKQGRPGQHTKYVRHTPPAPRAALAVERRSAAVRRPHRRHLPAGGQRRAPVAARRPDRLQAPARPGEAARAVQVGPGGHARPAQEPRPDRGIPLHLLPRVARRGAHRTHDPAIRRCMAAEHIRSLPLYPEGRPCKAPTADRIFHVSQDVRRHRLLGPSATVRQRFYAFTTRSPPSSARCSICSARHRPRTSPPASRRSARPPDLAWELPRYHVGDVRKVGPTLGLDVATGAIAPYLS